jgi:hypothetical protein
MPTVTALADLICQTTGLNTSGAERTIVIAGMNAAYGEAVRRSGCYRKPLTAASLTSGTADYTFGTSPLTDTDVVKLRWLTITGGGATTTRLDAKSEGEILQLRSNSSSTGTSRYFCVVYPTLMLYPTPGSGVTLNGSYEAAPKTLVESAPGAGEESTPTAFPADFHTRILFHGGVMRALEFDSGTGDASYHRERFEEGVGMLSEFANEFGGVEGAGVLGDDSIVWSRDSY